MSSKLPPKSFLRVHKVRWVEVLPGHRLDLRFDDGTARVVDLSGLVGRGVFAPWTDPSFFASVRIGEHGEVCWGEDLELCPDSLYLLASGRTPESVFPALNPSNVNA
jgi:hypothetical protein